MPDHPDRHSLEALRAFDTPTICNALEIVVPARRAFGFTRRQLIAPFPELKPVVGFARTALWRWRDRLFILLTNLALDATEFFRIPPNRVVELGGQIEI